MYYHENLTGNHNASLEDLKDHIVNPDRDVRGLIVNQSLAMLLDILGMFMFDGHEQFKHPDRHKVRPLSAAAM